MTIHRYDKRPWNWTEDDHKQERRLRGHIALVICLAVLAAALAALSSCTQYTVTRYLLASAELRTYAPGAVVASNTCSGHAAEVDAVFLVLDKVLDAHRAATPSRWGSAPISVCVVENRPFVMCTGNPLAGCSYNGPVFVAILWSNPLVKDSQVAHGYDWRATLLYELLGTLAMRGGLVDTPAGQGKTWEAAFMRDARVKAVLADATKGLW